MSDREEKLVAITKKTFTQLAWRATHSESMKELTTKDSMIFLILAVYSAEIAAEIFGDGTDAKKPEEKIEKD